MHAFIAIFVKNCTKCPKTFDSSFSGMNILLKKFLAVGIISNVHFSFMRLLRNMEMYVTR